MQLLYMKHDCIKLKTACIHCTNKMWYFGKVFGYYNCVTILTMQIL